MTIKSAQLRQPTTIGDDLETQDSTTTATTYFPPTLQPPPTATEQQQARLAHQKQVSVFRAWVIITVVTTIISAMILGVFLFIWIFNGVKYRWWVSWYMFIWIAFMLLFIVSLITSIRRYFLFAALLARSEQAIGDLELQQQQHDGEYGISQAHTTVELRMNSPPQQPRPTMVDTMPSHPPTRSDDFIDGGRRFELYNMSPSSSAADMTYHMPSPPVHSPSWNDNNNNRGDDTYNTALRRQQEMDTNHCK